MGTRLSLWSWRGEKLKLTYFDQIAPINGIFHQIYVHKHDGNNFCKLLEIKFSGIFSQILTYDVILPPKWVIFGQNGPNWVILEPQWLHRLTYMENGKNYFLWMLLKFISVRFMDINFVKNAINGVNLVKIGNFWWKYSKLGHFGGNTAS